MFAYYNCELCVKLRIDDGRDFHEEQQLLNECGVLYAAWGLPHFPLYNEFAHTSRVVKSVTPNPLTERCH